MKNHDKVIPNNYYRYDEYGQLISFGFSSILLSNRRADGVAGTAYKINIAKGNSATTPLSGLKEVYKQEPWTASSEFHFVDPATGHTTHGASFNANGDTGLPGPRVNSTLYDEQATQLALVQFRSNALQALSTFSGGTFLGELSEAVRMIRHPMKGLTNSIGRYGDRAKKMVNRNMGNVRKSNKDLQSIYLEYTFGWLPFLNDIDNACQAFAEVATGVPSKRIYAKNDISTGGIATYEGGFNAKSGYQPGNLQLNYSSKTTSSCRIVGGVKLKTELDSSKLDAYAERFGFTLQNFVPTIYNLIPFSFVVDYFSNVGDFVSAASAQNIPTMWINLTKMVKVESSGSLVTEGPDYNSGTLFTSGSYTGGSFSYSGSYFERSSQLPDLSLSALRFEPPSMKQLLNLGVLISALTGSKSTK